MFLRMLAAVVLVALTSLCGVPARAAFLTTVPLAGGGSVATYVARPEGAGPFPAVVILSGCGGVDGLDVVAADRLVPLGYVGVTIDALGPAHPNGVCGERAGDGAAAQVAATRAVLAWLREQPYVNRDRLALIGFSMGGDALLDLIDPSGGATLPPGVRAGVAFYPGCVRRAADVRVPLAIFDGDADRITPAAPCAAFAQAATAAGHRVEITTYPGATHGFNVPGPDRTFFGEPVRYDASATADAAHRTAAFLAQAFAAP